RQLEVLVLVIAPRRRGEHQHRPAELAEPEQLHFAAEGRGGVLHVIANHCGRGMLYDAPPRRISMAKKRIGLIFGMEDTFPWALIDAIHARAGDRIEAGPAEISYL